MKLKQEPDDFQVEELTNVQPGRDGPFAFYRLEKRGWATPDAIQAIRRRWQLDLKRLSYGGLKDRHALTIQYLTIHRGPKRGLTHHGVRLEYQGQVAAPYTSRDILANRFQIVLRALLPEEMDKSCRALEQVRRDGVPNYFDDQRFGSIPESGEFMARFLVLGQYEEALKLALTAPSEFDRAAQKQEKAILRNLWGQWIECKRQLPRGHARSLVDYLVSHPVDFRGAVVRLRPELRGLYLSAYQSHLWNRMLALWLTRNLRPEQLLSVRLKLGDVPMHCALDEEQKVLLTKTALALPTARGTLEAEGPDVDLMNTVLSEEGLQRSQLKIKGVRDLFFSRGTRLALCLPQDLRFESQPDERDAGRLKLLLVFDLPRGSYATLIVKRITSYYN